MWWSSLLEHCPKWGKDDGDYDSPTSRDETPDFMKNKRGQRSPPNRKKEKRGKRKRKRKKWWEKKREGTMLLSFSTLVLQSSTMIFMIESLLFCHFHIVVGIFHYRTWLVYSNNGLPQNSHHTYLLWHFHSHSEIYCHATFHRSVYYDTLHDCHITFAWSCSWHRICGKAIVHNSFIHVTLDSLHIPVHRRRHSYSHILF